METIKASELIGGIGKAIVFLQKDEESKEIFIGMEKLIEEKNVDAVRDGLKKIWLRFRRLETEPNLLKETNDGSENG